MHVAAYPFRRVLNESGKTRHFWGTKSQNAFDACWTEGKLGIVQEFKAQNLLAHEDSVAISELNSLR